MNKRHSNHQWSHTTQHHLVFWEEALDSKVAAANPNDDDEKRESSRPPADE